MRIAILEDEAPLAELMSIILERAGHRCHQFKDIRSLMRLLRQESFDLLLLDWHLPDGSGLDLLHWARTHCDPCPPTIMVTARSESDDIVKALEAGADDYVIKPIDEKVLEARVSAVLRRTYKASNEELDSEFLHGARFDQAATTVTMAGVTTCLTAKEFLLTLTFFRHLGRPLSRPHLLEAVWGRNPDLPTRTLDVHISRIRNRLSLKLENGFQLTSVHGFGYRLEKVMPS